MARTRKPTPLPGWALRVKDGLRRVGSTAPAHVARAHGVKGHPPELARWPHGVNDPRASSGFGRRAGDEDAPENADPSESDARSGWPAVRRLAAYASRELGD